MLQSRTFIVAPLGGAFWLIPSSYAFSASTVPVVSKYQALFPRPSSLRDQVVLFTTARSTEENIDTTDSLKSMFPDFADSLSRMGLDAPTPIQQSSAQSALEHENLLLVAPTGSGKTLAYLLPALTKAMRDNGGTVLLVAPTRELAVQLLRDTVELLDDVAKAEADYDDDDDDGGGVRLAIRGLEPPLLENGATVLVGTPAELYDSLQYEGSAFLGSLSAVILDEVDVLLPPSPKRLRTALDAKGGRAKTAQDERRQKEQKRKINAVKRRGVQLDDDSNRILSDTERILGLVANSRLVNGVPQILAGSATASRKTLDRLNQALRTASQGAAVPLGNNVKLCRPEEVASENDTERGQQQQQQQQQQHTIRAVTVPAEVEHRYIELGKDAASDPTQVLHAVARAVSILKPETSLLFLCGEFGKPTTAEKGAPPREVRGATSQARRNAKRKADGLYAKMETKNKVTQSKGIQGLSALKACKLLSELGIAAQPLHVALGLEKQAKTENDDEDAPMFLVTFEGSARGLHLDEVDAVFVVGRPTSAASYLHLAGRVGRAFIDEDGKVVARPGTVVSVCTKGSAVELDKWTRQIGGLSLEEVK